MGDLQKGSLYKETLHEVSLHTELLQLVQDVPGYGSANEIRVCLVHALALDKGRSHTIRLNDGAFSKLSFLIHVPPDLEMHTLEEVNQHRVDRLAKKS